MRLIEIELKLTPQCDLVVGFVLMALCDPILAVFGHIGEALLRCCHGRYNAAVSALEKGSRQALMGGTARSEVMLPASVGLLHFSPSLSLEVHC